MWGGGCGFYGFRAAHGHMTVGCTHTELCERPLPALPNSLRKRWEMFAELTSGRGGIIGFLIQRAEFPRSYFAVLVGVGCGQFLAFGQGCSLIIVEDVIGSGVF